MHFNIAMTRIVPKATDMRRYGFLSAVKMFNTAEWVHCDYFYVSYSFLCDNFFSFVLIPATRVEAGLVITTPQGTLVSPTSSQSFVSGHPAATTMIVSARPPHGNQQ